MGRYSINKDKNRFAGVLSLRKVSADPDIIPHLRLHCFAKCFKYDLKIQPSGRSPASCLSLNNCKVCLPYTLKTSANRSDIPRACVKGSFFL